MPKKTDPSKKKKIRQLLDEKMNPQQIHEITEIPVSTIYRYKAEYEKETEQKLQSNLESEKRSENRQNNQGNSKSKGNSKDKDKSEKQPSLDDENILSEAEGKAKTEITKTLSGQISQEFLSKIKSGGTVYKMEQEYKESVEAMGYDWDYFLVRSAELLYEILLYDYLKRQQQITVDDVVAMRMAGKLEDGEKSEEFDMKELEKYVQ